MPALRRHAQRAEQRVFRAEGQVCARFDGVGVAIAAHISFFDVARRRREADPVARDAASSSSLSDERARAPQTSSTGVSLLRTVDGRSCGQRRARVRHAEAGYARGGSAPRAQGRRVRPSRHTEKSNALERKVGGGLGSALARAACIVRSARKMLCACRGDSWSRVTSPAPVLRFHRPTHILRRCPCTGDDSGKA